tara:strand:- start:6486 stop:6638 length:153 start_codon:yes stop_codon:yes gene_type:complete
LHKGIYHIIRLFDKKKALNYAIKRQIISTRDKKSLEWYYWYEKIMNHDAC